MLLPFGEQRKMQNEDLSRLEMLIGSGKLAKLQKAHFYIIGLGGVGGYAAEAAARFGIGKITLVDGDIVERSNLNRQLCALNSTIGKSKVDVVKERILDINRDCKVTALKTIIRPDEDFDKFFEDKPDFVIEAIDTIPSKVSLLRYLSANNIKVVSSMGAGLRFDASQIKKAVLFKTIGCPLAAKIRKEFKKQGLEGKFTCIYSSEKPMFTKSNNDDRNILGKYPLGSNATIPAIFGLFAANEAVKEFLL